MTPKHAAVALDFEFPGQTEERRGAECSGTQGMQVALMEKWAQQDKESGDKGRQRVEEDWMNMKMSSSLRYEDGE